MPMEQSAVFCVILHFDSNDYVVTNKSSNETKRKTAPKTIERLSCVVFAWSWQCDSNTLPAELETGSYVDHGVGR